MFHETAEASSLPEIVLGEFETHGREKTLTERELRPLPAPDSPLVGDIARADPRWPLVLGLVETELKPQARLDVGVSGSDAPLIASWEFGRGRAVAVTTDADGRWSDRWVRWETMEPIVDRHASLARFQRVACRSRASRSPIARRTRTSTTADSKRGPAAVWSRGSPGPTDGQTSEVALTRTAPGHFHGRFATRWRATTASKSAAPTE